MERFNIKGGRPVIAISKFRFHQRSSAVVEARENRRAPVPMLSNTLRSPLGNLADISFWLPARPEGPLSAGALSAKGGAMLLVEVLIDELLSHDSLMPQRVSRQRVQPYRCCSGVSHHAASHFPATGLPLNRLFSFISFG